MRAFSTLLQAPWSILFSSFALKATTAAAPVPEVELKFLTPETFNSSVANGVWFVEHFSPYCRHCRDFAPTWNILAEDNAKASNPGINLAQVNCVVYGDLCDANGVKGYPQMNLYRNGEFIEQYKDVRVLENLEAYLKEKAEPTAESEAVLTVTASEAPPTHTSAFYVQTARANVNPSGSVLALDAGNFQDVINEGPVFIKYFAPWCGHCKKLAPIWSQLAKKTQNKLNIAEVNCDDHSSICRSQDVTGYPMLIFYSSGAKSEYTGPRKLDRMSDFVEKATANAVQSIQSEKLDEHVRDSGVAYLLLHAVSDTSTLDRITKTSGILVGSVPIFTATSPELFSRFAISTSWALLALKDGDSSAPTATFCGSNDDALAAWLFANRLPTTLELTQETFQNVMNAPHKPLVALVAVTKETKENIALKIRDIGKKWRSRTATQGGRDVVFTYMDANKWASWMKTMYGMKLSDEPAVIIADHSRLIYYDIDQKSEPIHLSSTSIFAAIEGIEKRVIAPKHSENTLERATRWISGNLTFIEDFVVNKPFYAILLFISILVVFFYLMTRIFAEDVPDPRYAKSRLD